MVQQKENNKPRTVAVVRFSALGDVALAIPVLYRACEAHPDTNFIMVTARGREKMFLNPPRNLTLLPVDVHAYPWKGPLGMIRLMRRLKTEYGVTDLVDIHDVLRTRMLRLTAHALGIKVSRLHKDRAGRRALTRPKNKVMRPLESSAARYAEVFRRAGFEQQGNFRGLFSGPRTAPWPVSLPPAEIKIGIAPFAAHKGKIYPQDQMLKVLELIERNFPTATVYLFGGGPREMAVFSQWRLHHPAAVSVPEQLHGLRDELALMNHLDVMLAMDSGNMHLAALAGTPVVSIWGATHPYCGFTPLNTVTDDIIQQQLPCRPCSVYGNRPCRRSDYACLTGITPEKVLEHLKKYIHAHEQEKK